MKYLLILLSLLFVCPSIAEAECCKICHSGKACGDTCIAAGESCTKGLGCACDGVVAEPEDTMTVAELVPLYSVEVKWADAVCLNKKNTIYHGKNCHHSGDCASIPRDKAEARGARPCKFCRGKD